LIVLKCKHNTKNGSVNNIVLIIEEKESKPGVGYASATKISIRIFDDNFNLSISSTSLGIFPRVYWPEVIANRNYG